MRTRAPAAPSVDAGVLQLVLGANHTCARYTDTVRCWGAKGSVGFGLGAGADAQLQPPAQGVALPSAPVELAATRGATCTIVNGGAVFCWGENSVHQLGQGPEDTGDRTTPVKVNLPAPAAQITGGGNHFCALLTNGALACWGLGTSGQLGLGEGLLNRDKPRRVVGL
jgi:alpha-tubulin suppressor-like RCC1 family protein